MVLYRKRKKLLTSFSYVFEILMEGGETQMAEKKEVVGKTEGIIVIVLAVVAFVLGMLAR